MYLKALLRFGVVIGACFIVGGCATHKTTTQPQSQSPATAATPIQIGQRFALHSNILNEDRPYSVYLPRSYSNQWFAPRRYPVLYLLDGDAHFSYVSGLTEYMGWTGLGNMEIPEFIIVAIPNTVRTRDLTPTHTLRDYNGKDDQVLSASGGGTNFVKFIHEELAPHIESEYRTMPYRILVGHSFGGLLALDCLFQQPPVFQALIAIDPSVWWDDRVEVRRLTEWLPKQNNLAGTVYISMAKHPAVTKDYNPNIMDDPIRDFAAMLKARNSSSFRSTSQYFEEESHGSVPPLSTYHGLRFVFEGYQPPPGGGNTAASVSEQFAKLSTRLGVDFKPPEEYVNDVGGSRLQDRHDPDAAIEWFKLNTANYPQSFNAYASLAGAYEAKSNKALAIANFEKSLQLKADNAYPRERLRRLKAPAKPSGPLTNGVYQLINRQSHEALTVKDAATNDGADLVQTKYTGGGNQQWTLKNQGDGFYEITAVHSGKSLDINAESTSNGAKALQWPFKDSANQIWKIVSNDDGTFRLLNEHSGLALEATEPAGTGGPTVQQWEWKNRSNQKWLIKPVAAK